MNLSPPENRRNSPASVTSQSVRRIGLSVAGLCLFLMVPAVHGQTEVPLADLKKNYQQSIEELRTAVKATKRAEAIHFHVESDAAFEYREQWEKAAADAEQAYAKLKDHAVELFLAEQNPDSDLINIVRRINAKLYEEGKIGKCYDVSKRLAILFPEEESVKTDLARAAILNNDFETATAFTDGNMGTIDQFPPLERGLYSYARMLKEQFSRELDLREAEGKADDLPRVELKTKKGEIVIELFENEAPETVGNFINLVEIGFYDGIIMHPVHKRLLSQTSLMTMQRHRSAGYTIYDEHQRKDARHHFRGSVCMATPPGVTNAGSSSIIILNVPGPHIDNGNTVFGRVISGMDVVDSLQPTAEFDEEGKETTIQDIRPDTIISAKVIRKRDHEYVPNRVNKQPETSK